MKKMLIYIILTIVSVAIICFTVVYFTAHRMKLDLSGIFENIEESNHKKALFLNDIDLEDGHFALYVDHEEFGEFMVLDQDALKENKDSLYVRVNLLNIFSGLTRRQRHGVTLFKGKSFVKNKKSGFFKKFDLGTLANYAIPVKKHTIEGNKALIQEKYFSLQDKENIFYPSPPIYFPDNLEFSFTVYLPSIALPVTRKEDSWGMNSIASINGMEYDNWLNENRIGSRINLTKELENCIREKAKMLDGLDVTISINEETNNYLVHRIGANEYPLTRAENKHEYIRLENYHNFRISAHFRATKKDAEQLYAMDFSDCHSEEQNNRVQLVNAINELVKQSELTNLTHENGTVELYGNKNMVTRSNEITEQLYSLWWLEIEKIK